MKKATVDIAHSNPETCPYCDSDNITVEATDKDTFVSTDTVYCWSCKTDWYEVYNYSVREPKSV